MNCAKATNGTGQGGILPFEEGERGVRARSEGIEGRGGDVILSGNMGGAGIRGRGYG